MTTINISSRKLGLTRTAVYQIALELKDGHSVAIASNLENDYCKNILFMLKDKHNINAIAKRTTRKEPMNNREIIYNKFAEPIGLNILPQEDIFTGWILKKQEL